MTTYEEMEQLQAFARIDGALIAGLWTLSFACFIGNFYAPLLGIFAFAIGAFSLVFAAMRLRKFRDEVRDGFISFRRALAYGIMQYLNASLLFAVAQFLYFQFIDHGFMMTKYTAVMQNPEFMEMMRTWGLTSDDVSLVMNNMAALRPIDVALQFFTTNVFMGLFVSVPVAILMRRSPRNRKY